MESKLSPSELQQVLFEDDAVSLQEFVMTRGPSESYLYFLYSMSADRGSLRCLQYLEAVQRLTDIDHCKADALLRAVRKQRFHVVQHYLQFPEIIQPVLESAIELAIRSSDTKILNLLLSHSREMQTFDVYMTDADAEVIFSEIRKETTFLNAAACIDRIISRNQYTSEFFSQIIRFLQTTKDFSQAEANILTKRVGATYRLHQAFDKTHFDEDSIQKHGFSEKRLNGLRCRTACRHIVPELVQSAEDLSKFLKLSCKLDSSLESIWDEVTKYPLTIGRQSVVSFIKKLAVPVDQAIKTIGTTGRVIRQIGEDFILKRADNGVYVVCGEEQTESGIPKLVMKSGLFTDVQEVVAVDSRVILFGSLQQRTLKESLLGKPSSYKAEVKLRKSSPAVFVAEAGEVETLEVPEHSLAEFRSVFQQFSEAAQEFMEFVENLQEHLDYQQYLATR